jgi:hypothetical protein
MRNVLKISCILTLTVSTSEVKYCTKTWPYEVIFLVLEEKRLAKNQDSQEKQEDNINECNEPPSLRAEEHSNTSKWIVSGKTVQQLKSLDITSGKFKISILTNLIFVFIYNFDDQQE